MKFKIAYLFPFLLFIACKTKTNNVPVIGFMDAFEDNTISKARIGFLQALKDSGFSEEKKTVKIIYRNAMGDIPALTQIAKYFISEKVDLIATNPSLSTITALQQTQQIPIFMMVSPLPNLLKVMSKSGKAPANLFGVGEDLNYIDTSFSLIAKLVKPKSQRIKVGLLYNQAETQSKEALEKIKQIATRNNMEVVANSVSNSAELKTTTLALLNNNIDAFFANPDNTIFAGFETIYKSCTQAHVPVFTSEAGLVARGAVCAYGADMFAWGYQAGLQAVQFLKQKSTNNLQCQIVHVRKKVYNPEAAKNFLITFDSSFIPYTVQ